MIEQDLSPISQGLDYLGDLNAKLRDLRGFDTLANELIQNADDAKAAWIVFDIGMDRLIVENDAVFEDCGEIREEECPWVYDPTIEHRCDFHRFRKVAGGDKRNQEDTTGAFGFGFVSVYQITNNPELVSAGHHWRLHPDAMENNRIRPQAVNEFFHGTRFIFPWAIDPECPLRKRLGCSAIRPEDIDDFAEKVAANASQALLFLRYVTSIEIRRNGITLKRVERTKNGPTTLIADGKDVVSWQIFGGNFDALAATLRTTHGNLIEAKRSAKVAIAVRHDGVKTQGLYFATLPTQQSTDLPIHINAAFYPKSSRKHLALGSGYEGQWNMSAIEAAAVALANALPALLELLGYKGIWPLLVQVERVHHDARDGRIKKHMEVFWNTLKPVVSRSAIVFTSAREWRVPQDVLLLQDRKEEEACLPILEQLGMSHVHPELNEYRNLLTNIGVRVLTALDLCKAFTKWGLNRPIAFDEAPEWLRDEQQHAMLAHEIQILMQRSNSQDMRQQMAACSVVRSIKGMFCPPNTIRRASPETVAVFEPFGATQHFADHNNPAGVQCLVNDVSVEDILLLLEKVPQNAFANCWAQDPATILKAIALCEAHRTTFQQSPDARARLRRLKIWPSKDQLYPLDSLVVPGDFTDPLGIATVLDKRVATKHRQFLVEDLGAALLTVQHYAGTLVPNLFNSGNSPMDAAVCRRLIAELAEHTDTLRKESHLRLSLASCAMIPCCDGKLHAARNAYFSTEAVVDLFEESVPTVIRPTERKAVVEDFLQWLGVADFPRSKEVVQRIWSIVQRTPGDPANRDFIQRIIQQLGKYWDKFGSEQRKEFELLRSIPWLPAKGRLDRWFMPIEVYTQFQSHLFETTGQFLEVSLSIQHQVKKFITFLQIPTDPTCELVAKYILQCASEDRKMSKDVYAFLNRPDHLSEPAIQQLKGKACLPVEGHGYVRPDQVFWKNHALQPHLFSLGTDFEAYRALLRVLEVHEEPTATDAVKLLCRIADGYNNTHLSDDMRTVIMHCWMLISEALRSEQIEPGDLASVRTRKVIANEAGYLNRPNDMFFEDRPNLAARFGDALKTNVILPLPSTALGMELAGVHPLSRAVEIRLVECSDVVPANELQRVLQERRHLIERVIYPSRIADARWNTNILDRLQLQWCSQLEVGCILRAFNREYHSPPEPADTYYDVGEEILYIQRSGAAPWLDIASGLASAMNCEAPEGTVSPGLALALSALSLQSGSVALDKLKIPPLQLKEIYQSTQSAPVNMGGIEVLDSEDNRDFVPTEIPRDAVTEDLGNMSGIDIASSHEEDNSGEVTDSSQSSRMPDDEIEGRDPTTSPTGKVSRGRPTGEHSGTAHILLPPVHRAPPNSSVRSLPGTHRTPVLGGLQGLQLSSARDGRLREKHSNNHRPAPEHTSEDRASSSGRMRSYVFSNPAENIEDGTRLRNTEPIDKAGIACVMAAEQNAGRIPEVMPHYNAGYDIYSLDAEGENERYIEVKSLSSDWQVKGVLVSAAQFLFAQKMGPKFWLYVVERAKQDDVEITRIQNPAQRVSEYWFDDGWRACAANENPIAEPENIC